jgi:hypothetical protein
MPTPQLNPVLLSGQRLQGTIFLLQNQVTDIVFK